MKVPLEQYYCAGRYSARNQTFSSPFIDPLLLTVCVILVVEPSHQRRLVLGEVSGQQGVHKFCRFRESSAAMAALQRGEVMVAGDLTSRTP